MSIVYRVFVVESFFVINFQIPHTPFQSRRNLDTDIFKDNSFRRLHENGTFLNNESSNSLKILSRLISNKLNKNFHKNYLYNPY